MTYLRSCVLQRPEALNFLPVFFQHWCCQSYFKQKHWPKSKDSQNHFCTSSIKYTESQIKRDWNLSYTVFALCSWEKNGCYFLLRCLCNKMLSKCLKYFLFMPLSNLGFNATFYSGQISFSNSCSLQKGLEIFPRAHWKFQLKIRSCQSQTKGNKEETAPSPPY